MLSHRYDHDFNDENDQKSDMEDCSDSEDCEDEIKMDELNKKFNEKLTLSGFHKDANILKDGSKRTKRVKLAMGVITIVNEKGFLTKVIPSNEIYLKGEAHALVEPYLAQELKENIEYWPGDISDPKFKQAICSDDFEGNVNVATNTVEFVHVNLTQTIRGRPTRDFVKCVLVCQTFILS